MLKIVTSLAIGTGLMFMASAMASGDPVIGDERAVLQHLSLSQAAQLSTKELMAHGEVLFRAKFTTLDGAGRPQATQAEVPTKRSLGGSPAFFRTSGPEANACDGCHNQPEVGGAGEFVTNVFASEGVNDAEFDTLDTQFSNERGTPPVHGSGLIELLAREMTADLHELRKAGTVKARNSGKVQTIELGSKGVSFGRLIAKPSGFLDISQIEGIDFDLVVRPFSQKGVFTSLRQFTINALNAHHGMQALERYGAQWTDNTDFDADEKNDEITKGDVTALVAFQAGLGRPEQVTPDHPVLAEAVKRGEQTFAKIGCTDCHRAHLPLKSATFSEPNPYNNAGNLRVADNAPVVSFDLKTSGLKKDNNGHWLVPVFTDLKRHKIADDSHPYFANELLGQRYIPRDVFITAKLWGAGKTAPYGHRGDVTTLREVILYHGGEAKGARAAFEKLETARQADIIEFLKSLQILEEAAS